MAHCRQFLQETSSLALEIDHAMLERMVKELVDLREREGRLFFLGVGGSAANCSHAVNDFRKLCSIEAYSPVDNVSELTARANDEGWDTIFSAWLQESRAGKKDAVFILSVGGGDSEQNISPNIVSGLKLAKERGMTILGIVGRDGGYTKKVGDAVVVVPPAVAERITPHTEGFQAVIWHCLVSHPALQKQGAKWESVTQTT